MHTNQNVTIKFRDYGDITVPKGTRLTHQTACGIDNNYHFVEDLDWIDTNYPKINKVLRHDAFYYGIDIPKEFVQH